MHLVPRDGLLAIVGMDQPRPQLLVGEERLGRVADDRLDLRAHVREPTAIGDRRVGDVDVDGGGHTFDEDPISRIRLGPLNEGDLEVIAGPTRVVEQPTALVDQQRLADTGEEDHRERRQVDQAELGRADVAEHDEAGAPEQCHERQPAVNERRQSAESSVRACRRVVPPAPPIPTASIPIENA